MPLHAAKRESIERRLTRMCSRFVIAAAIGRDSCERFAIAYRERDDKRLEP